MNRKLFALLLLIPIAIFATDRLTATNTPDGGDKEKKTAQATEKANPAKAIVAQEASQGQSTADVAVKPTKTEAQQQASEKKTDPAIDKSNATMVDEIKASLSTMTETYYEDQSNNNVLWVGSDELGKDLSTWLENHVERPLRKANPMKVNLENSFSRCPSGYHILVLASEGGPSNEGWLIGADGCMDEPIGKFRYDVTANTVKVHIGTTDQLVGLSQYFQLYKSARA